MIWHLQNSLRCCVIVFIIIAENIVDMAFEKTISPYSTGNGVRVGYPMRMKSTKKKRNVHGQRKKFAFGTQRHLYSTDWRRGLASGITQFLGLASGVTQILALGIRRSLHRYREIIWWLLYSLPCRLIGKSSTDYW